MNLHGLLESDVALIRSALERFLEIDEVILFGSRAMGNFKSGSDVDLAIVGDRVTQKTIIGLNEWLNETYPLPYMFDLHDYNSITNASLKDHIQHYGIRIYSRNE